MDVPVAAVPLWPLEDKGTGPISAFSCPICFILALLVGFHFLRYNVHFSFIQPSPSLPTCTIHKSRRCGCRVSLVLTLPPSRQLSRAFRLLKSLARSLTTDRPSNCFFATKIPPP